MATQIRIIGNPMIEQSFTGGKNTIELAFSYGATGSGVAPRQRIGTTWTSIDTGSCTSIRYIAVKNVDTTSSFQLSTTGSGTILLATAQPGDLIVIPWTGSQALWGKSTPSASIVPIMIQEW